jgi:hypothetical protein
MILFLRGLFIVVIISMLWVTSWASLHCPLFAIPREVFTHPWFIATLFDTYWAFITFFVWVCFKQTTAIARLAWFVAIILLGNLAMASYCLNELFRVPAGGKASAILTVRREGPGWLGVVLAVLGVVVTLLGLKQ